MAFTKIPGITFQQVIVEQKHKKTANVFDYRIICGYFFRTESCNYFNAAFVVLTIIAATL